MLVKEVMKKVKVIDKDITLKSASEIMKSEDISSLVVIQGEKIIGIITQEDLAENFGKKKKVSEVMTKKVITISSEERVERAADVMKAEKIRFLPVVDSKEHLAGIISAKDLLGEVTDSGDFLIG